MKEIRFTIPLTVTGDYSMNRLGSRSERAEKKKTIEQATGAALILSKLRDTVIEPPVEITLYYDSQLDIDNCGFVTKAIIDALKVKLLGGDDNKRHVVRITQEFWSGKDIGVEIVSVASEDAPSPSKGIRKTLRKN